jgi:hypothetical protein
MANYAITFFDTTFPTDEENRFTTVLGLRDTATGEAKTVTLNYTEPDKMVNEFYTSPFGADNTLDGITL